METETTRVETIQKKNLSSGAIAGIVIAVVIVVAVIIFVIVWFTLPMNTSSSSSASSSSLGSLTPIEVPIVDTGSVKYNWGNSLGFASIQANAKPGYTIDQSEATLTIAGNTYSAGPPGVQQCTSTGNLFSCGWQYPELVGQLTPGTPATFQVRVADNSKGSETVTFNTTTF